MKKLFYSIIGFIALATTLNSCVKDTDFDTPQITCEEPQIPAGQLSSIQNVLDQWNAANPGGNSLNAVEFVTGEEAPVYISGYVVSNDQAGNFYEELFIQDAEENPQYAVKIALDFSSLFTKYDMGRKIYLKLNDLAINKSHGEMVIGIASGSYINGISENRAKKAIFRSCNTPNLMAKEITLAEVNNSVLGMYVKIDSLQFDFDVLNKPFVNPLDSYDSYRMLVSCASNASIELETSTFASYREQIVPSGSGSVTGIISRDYGDDFYVLRVSDPSAFTFEGERCDPIFQDGFSNGFAQWTTYSVTGAQTWSIDPTYGNPGACAKMSGYAGGNNANEDWLISKPISLAGIDAANLSFQTARNYSGPNMEVKISTDYDGVGNPNGFTWANISATLSPGSWTWTDSGSIDLSSYLNQTVYIGFKFTSTSSSSATYEIDNVKISD